MSVQNICDAFLQILDLRHRNNFDCSLNGDTLQWIHISFETKEERDQHHMDIDRRGQKDITDLRNAISGMQNIQSEKVSEVADPVVGDTGLEQ